MVAVRARDALGARAGSRLTECLRNRGPTIDDEQTRIVEVDEGFNVPGFHVRRFGRGERTLAAARNENVVEHLRVIVKY